MLTSSVALALLALQTPPPVPPGPDSLLTVVRQTASAFQDTAQARAAGFVPLGIGRLQDRTPFQGEHWLLMRRVLTGDTTLTEPPFLMYAQVNGKLELVGVAYGERIGHDEPMPHGLHGHEAPWHLHQACVQVPGEGFALADGVDDCRERGGQPTPRQTAMIHVWSGVNSPDGLFAHDNPALPFVAVGLKPPADAEWKDHMQSMNLRSMALALGELYDARLPYARRIETMNQDRALADSLAAHRAMVVTLVAALKRAEAANDTRSYRAWSNKVVGEGEALRKLYQRMAQTPQIKNQLDRQYSMAVMGDMH